MIDKTRAGLPEPRPCILLVEDEPSIRRLFQRTFSEFNILTVATVADAMEIIQSGRETVGVLLADHYLPDGTGIDVLACAREHQPDTVRLLTTSRADLDQAMRAVNEAGIASFITKPWSIESLRKTLAGAMDQWHERTRERQMLDGKRETLLALASSIAHEMRTPLATMRLRIEAFTKYWADMVGAYRSAIARGEAREPTGSRLRMLIDTPAVVRQEVDRASIAVEMLLASAKAPRIDASEFGLHGMAEVVYQALEGYPFDGDMKNRVKVHVPADFMYYGSSVLLVFILYNLIKNSLHAIHKKGSGAITIKLIPGSDFNQLEFTDTGMGIEAEHLPHIFEDFYTTKTTGTGVGLSFCRTAMKAMGGDLTCRSEPGEFTTFTLRFPSIRATM